jgi:glycerate kinase
MSLTILVAPSGFKESLSARECADRIAEGVHAVLPEALVLKAPMVDGGEGFAEALVAATGGNMYAVTVTGPVGEPVASSFGILGGHRKRVAVLEMAAAAGLRLVPRDRRDPTHTTSYGVGELIRTALDAGAERILLGCGDSGIRGSRRSAARCRCRCHAAGRDRQPARGPGLARSRRADADADARFAPPARRARVMSR